MRSSSLHTSLLAGLALTTALLSPGIFAQAPEAPQAPKAPEAPRAPEAPKAPEAPRAPEAPKGAAAVHIVPGFCGPTNVRVFRFVNTTSMQEQNEIVTVVRNMVSPSTRVMVSPTQSALAAEGTDDQLAGIQKIIDTLDKPKKGYRLTYTLIDFDGTRRLGDQHYSMLLIPGQRTTLKQGNKVPIVTGTDYKEPSNPQTHVTYVDLGMNFDATLDGAGSMLQLKTKVEQSSVIEDRPTAAAAQDPVIRQAVFEGSAMLTVGKTQTIGALDITGTTRRIEIQVLAEPVAP